MHFLIIMKPRQKINCPADYDKYVSAEIPPESYNVVLRDSVQRNMMHGPCGEMNPRNVCMNKKGECKNKYPKDYCNETKQGLNSYPIYRRRANGEVLMVRGKSLDNRYVVPYNPYLLAKYDCHLNVEICSTIKAVKYLYKYIYKGHDKISFQVFAEPANNNLDEISTYQSGMWVSPPQAMWRLYRFLLNETSPSVFTLQLHLPNQQNVNFRANSDLRNVVTNPNSSRTMLTEYFRMNSVNAHARTLFYRQFPEDFVWQFPNKLWSVRKRGFAIGRIVTVNPCDGERYYLRLLLNAVKGATSFEHLCFVEGKQHLTFREAALALGLFEDDNSVHMCLAEASEYEMPRSLRRLFAILLVYCVPVIVRVLWEDFENKMVEDFLASSSCSPTTAPTKAIAEIGVLLQSMGKNIKDFDLPCNVESIRRFNVFRDIEDESNVQVPDYDLRSVRLLNESRKSAYDAIIEHAMTKKPGVFFIDGPGGTGKKFLYRALLASIRSRGLIGLATASSGVAASILPGGRTAHSRFKIPLNTENMAQCIVPKQGGLAKLLRETTLIVWDEAPMMKKEGIEAVDRLLQDVCSSQQLFGGKVVVFGGDFRQVLPVVPKSTPEQTIEASLLTSYLWPQMKKFRLTFNTRAQQDPSFLALLLRIGDGLEKSSVDGEVELPETMIINNHEEGGIQRLVDRTFQRLDGSQMTLLDCENRAILAPKNEMVNEINNLMMDCFEGEEIVYRSFDSAVEEKSQGFQEDFCNTLTPGGFPPHLLRLKVGCPVMLLRNLDPSQGMCNGTRLRCKSFQKM